MKQKKYFLISVFTLFLGLLFSQQTSAQDLTWSELKAQQDKERVSMENMQREAMTQLKELQKNTFDKLAAESYTSPGNILELAEKQKTERAEINRQFSEERTKLAQIHADERKNFLQNQKPKQ